MKVCTVFDSLGPYHIARLNAAAEEVELLSVELAGASAEYAWLRDERSIRFSHSSLLADRTKGVAPWNRLLASFQSLLDAFVPDALAIPGWSSKLALAALTAARRSSIPVVVMSESSAFDSRRHWLMEKVKRRYVTMCAAGLVGARSHRDYLHQLGLPADRVFLGYDAVDNDYFAQKALAVRTAGAEADADNEITRPYLLASARFIEKKNLKRMLMAYQMYLHQVLPEHKNATWDLVVLGDGPLRGELTSLAQQLNIGHRVHLPGFKQYDELPRYYARAKAFVHLSTSEQWGLVVNEAMASGLPVIVSRNCGCAAELVEHGVNGLVVDPENVESIVYAFRQLAAASASDLATMGAASADIIRQWGPKQFALGIKQAAIAAQAGPIVKPRLTDNLFLQILAKACG